LEILKGRIRKALVYRGEQYYKGFKKKQDARMWTGFIWLRIVKIGRFL
jgi:hypothetical protein